MSATTCTCKHPMVEHLEIEGLQHGHCKVPGCECGAFDPVDEVQPTDPGGSSWHTYIARATDESGKVGVEIKVVGLGSMGDETEKVMKGGGVDKAMALCEQAEEAFQKLTGESCTHSGASLMPYIMDKDADANGLVR